MSETTIRPLGRAITLCHIGTDRFKTARLSLVTVRPADARESPLATLLFGVLRRGSEGYPTLSRLNRALDELYGTTLTIRNYLWGDSHVISFTADMPEDAYLPVADRELDILSGAMHLLATLLLHPLTDEQGNLRAETVESEKQSLCDSLRAMANDTRTYAADRFRRLMCPDEPYGLSVGGTVETVESITAAELTAHYRRLLAACNACVYYVGRAPAERVESVCRRALGTWDPAPTPAAVTRPHPIPACPQAFSEDRAVTQGKLCIGWSCGANHATLTPAEEAALLVLNELFGVMQSSRLFCRVREELGLCYYCDSALDPTKGILWVASGIRSDRRREAEAAIRAELAAIADGHLTEAEVAPARLSLESGLRQTEDSLGALESEAHRRFMSGRTSTVDEQISLVCAVTPADVIAAAARLAPDTVFFLNGIATTSDGEGEDCDDD